MQPELGVLEKAGPTGCKSPPYPRRLDFLDGTRGIAAVLVLFHHVYGSAPFWTDAVRFSPLRILLTGRPSVLFFFVLSGYVLSYGVWTSRTSRDPWLYAVQRIVRIYLPYLAATLAAWMLYRIAQAGPLPELGDTFNAMWSTPISTGQMIHHLLLAGTPAANSLNIPAWSLVYELRISIFMPFLCGLYILAPGRMGLVAVVMFGVLHLLLQLIGLGATPYYGETVVENAIITVYFATLFIMGMVLARGAIGKASWMSCPGAVRPLLSLAAFVLVLANRDTTIVLGVVLTLYLCVTWTKASKVLGHPILLFLGRISFSLYLTHMIVLEFVLRQTKNIVPLFVSVPSSILLAFAVAWIFLVLVERPAHVLSKRIRFATPRNRAPAFEAAAGFPPAGSPLPDQT